MRKLLAITFLFMFQFFGLNAQKVGLVLSGGGADALAHIGVIKALEENKIPIDYITGTSMGALIGALYASGMPIEDIETYFTSDYFKRISTGELPKEFHYNYPLPEPEPIIIPIRFKKSNDGYSLLIPSKVIPSETFDMDVVKAIAQIEKITNYNFDSLIIPFRCVAADVVTKELVVFRDGSLSEALRASTSYPLFIKPIKIDGHLMYDGGIYNNFPVDVMCNEFSPDFIVGSNVSSNIPDPDGDDLFGQLQSILVKSTDFSITCQEGEMIEPNINFGTFSFDNAQEAVDSGYAETIRHIQHIRYHSPENDSSDRMEKIKRQRAKMDTIKIGDLSFTGINSKQAKYAKSVLKRKKKKDPYLTMETFERNYYRLYQETYIEDIRTKLKYNPETEKYDAIVDITPIKTITLDLGGNIASRPISEGFAGLNYNNLSTFGFRMGFSTYFGRFYQALNIHARFDFPGKTPVYFKPKFVIHNWNWFESRQSNLFVEDKPNYIIEGELYTGLEIGAGLTNQIKASTEISYLQMESRYYQTKTFTPSDTLDKTRFTGLNLKANLTMNNLNMKNYAYEGRRINAQATYTYGIEYFTPGSTSTSDLYQSKDHSYLILKLEIDKYFKLSNKLRFGLNITGVYSGMDFFNNYTSTVIQAPSFKPTPDSRTLFLESFHADRFAAVGAKFVFLPLNKIQIRAEGYIFQPYRSYVTDANNELSYGTPWADRFAILSGALVYATPIGPLSFSVNYYYNNPDISPEEEAPVTALLNFGYILFNKRAYH